MSGGGQPSVRVPSTGRRHPVKIGPVARFALRAFSYEHTVTADQIDAFCHVNNAAYLVIFERARWAVLDAIGTAWADVAASGVGPLVLGVEVSFVREVLLGETVTVETRFEPTSPRRFNVLHRMVGADGTLRALGTIRGSFFNFQTRKIEAPPDDVVVAMGLELPLPAAPVVQGVGGVFLLVEDLERSAAWYAEHLGLRLEAWGESRGVEFPGADRVPSLRVASTTFALVRADGPLPTPRTGRVNFRVPDLDALVGRLDAAGQRVERQPDDYGRFAWTYDPEGNRVELWEPPRIR